MPDRIGRYYRVWKLHGTGMPLHIGNVYSTSAWKVYKAIQKLIEAEEEMYLDISFLYKLYKIDRVPCDE